MVTLERIKEHLALVMDPEVPVLSIVDLGLVRSIEVKEAIITLGIAPTYTGCPAMDVIHDRVREALSVFEAPVKIEVVLHPPWTTDWM